MSDDGYGLAQGEAEWHPRWLIWALRWFLLPVYRRRPDLVRYGEQETIEQLAAAGVTVVGTPSVRIEADYEKRRIVLRTSAVVTGSADAIEAGE